MRDTKGTTKRSCDKDFAELSGELSGSICLKTLVLMGNALKLSDNSLVSFARFFGFVGAFLAPEHTWAPECRSGQWTNVDALKLEPIASPPG